MRKFITSTLIAASLACWVATAAPATDGRPLTRIYDGMTGGPAPARNPGLIVPDTRPPVVTSIGPTFETSYPFGTTVNLTASFTDDAATHTAVWTVNGTSFAGTVEEGTGMVTGNWTPDMPGYYVVTLTITDASGNSATVTTVVVIFDRGDGFMNGKGKFDSPAGAYVADPQAAGRVDFDFDARYRRDDLVPTGTTSFKFVMNGMDFEGTSEDWFMVGPARGMYRGNGTLNGVGGYRFLVSGVDGDDIAAGVVDKLRLKVTSAATGAVVYDNQMSAPDTAAATCPITAGGVDVRLPNGGLGHLSAFQPRVEPSASSSQVGFALAQNFPNPFRASTQVRFTLPERSHVMLTVLDVAGREIATLADGAWDAGSHSVAWTGRTDAGMAASRGVYFVRMAAGLASGERRFVSARKMIVLD